MPTAAQQIAQLQKLRAKPHPNLAIAPCVQAIAHHAAGTNQRLGELINLWRSVMPPSVGEHSVLTSLRAGVLHVMVDSSSVAYEIDQLLRSGTIRQLREQYRGTLVKVKCRVGKIE